MTTNPYNRTEIKMCDVCGNIVLVDIFGNGKCKHCGWIQNKDEEEFEHKTKISYPNLVPLSKAREQYKRGEPFKASFEDFVNGLYFYSEMLFTYHGKTYEVLLNAQKKIVFCCDTFQQEYSSREEFESKANIDGKSLKDIWQEVKNPSFMYCGG